jgi:predicted Ser/Thr protein kinase
MPAKVSPTCAHQSATEALTGDTLSGSERISVERHLETCETCRTLFRQRTSGRLPRIRNYTVVSEIGRGGFGVVYKAVHHAKQRTEALKVLFGHSAQRTAYFENEVRLVAQLRHPNIATLYDASLKTTPLYYTMEYVEGEHLDHYLRTHEVSLEQRIGLLRAVAEAVSYAHGEGVIHRDLKPQNILIDPQGEPRIVDFGIAKRLDFDATPLPPPEGHEGALGTYGYIAPEQLAGGEVDSRADVYGLGVLLFHTITGQPARFASDTHRLADMLREREVSRADDLAAIIARCVTAAPEGRYPSCAALVEDLDRYLAGQPLRFGTDPTLSYRLSRVAALLLRNHPGAVAAVVLLVLTLALSAALSESGAHWQAPGAGGTPRTALIGVMPSTLAAIRDGKLAADLPGLEFDDRRSYRLLYGELMRRLAEAEPRVVAWDYYFPECQPEFDAAFVAGVHALHAPVVVGDDNPDLNGQPRLCPEIRAAVHGWGTLKSTAPGKLEDSLFIPLALQRGLNPLIPALSVAAFGAALNPDCELDLRSEGDQILVCYRKRQFGAQEYRWETESQTLPIVKTIVVESDLGGFQSGDKCLLGRFRMDRAAPTRIRPLALEDVLAADLATRRGWFAGKAVVVGQMLPRIDQYELGAEKAVFGCEIQAQVLDDLLAGAWTHKQDRAALAWRVGAWCLGAFLVVNFVRWRSGWAARWVVAVAAGVVAAMFCLAPWLAQMPMTAATAELAIGGCALLAGGAAALAIRVLHQRQLQLTPAIRWPVEAANASTTVLASAPVRSSGGTGQ